MSESKPIQPPRRDFLKQVAAVAGLTLAPGVFLQTVSAAVNASQRWGLLIDSNKCGDCQACVTACHTENGITDHNRPETDAQWIRKVDLRHKTTGRVHSLPMMCQHCEHPPCVDVCPTGASFKRQDGIVLVDKHICIGCRYCMMACPYKARSFVHEVITDQKAHAPRGKGTVESCTLCVHRVDTGRLPSCVEACAATGRGAMLFGDMNDPNSELAQRLRTEYSTTIRADLRLNPGVRYQGI
ncbi:sulfate reduction electron transfer complex DsrMKJOP subunit DsrO [Thioflexithrix psekupsensis]|uniref:4Fe-4S ferredoxin n=1 Tax=Thioflexithrix psekupsensis TaxID=1570016 RepID=A0A251X8P1_9GAMM|nr:4Fe-4S dicluster domain-containing protein [Thioflexithrix psekupsensis]OUD14097.1 4Fe-4S ferredoxin [Thioflexithrix psekupsensis]